MSSINKRVGIAAIIMMSSVFLSRVIGLFREMVIAYTGGATSDVDAYQIAFIIPEILNHVIASGFLSVTFIPIFSKYLANDEENEGWKVFSIIMACFGFFLCVFIVISLIFTPVLIDIFAPGLDDPLVRSKAIEMTRIILPAQFFFFAGGLLMAVQFAKESFMLPALAPLFYNIGIITGGLFFNKWLGMKAFSWGALAGAFVGNFVIQYFGAKKAGMKFSIVMDFRHPELIKYILLTLPLMLGLTMTFSTEIFLKFFGSFLPHGSIASLNYALRVIFILVGFFGQAVGMASYPFLSKLVAQNKLKEMNTLLNNTLKKYISLVIPFSVLFMVCRHEIILILFQRGEFNEAATHLTSGVLMFLLIGTFAFAAQTVVVRGFYAMQNTLFPSIYGSLAVFLSLPIFWLGLVKMGVNGVALSISISAIFQVTLLYVLWNKKSQNNECKEVYIFFIKTIIISIFIGLFLTWIKGLLLLYINNMTFLGSLVTCMIIGVIFLIALLGLAYLMKLREIVDSFNLFFGLFKKAISI